MERQGRGGKPATLRIRLAGFLLLSAHLLFVCWFSFRPVAVPWVAPANLHPLHTIRAELADGSLQALLGLGTDLALYAPAGVLLPLAAGWLERSPAASALRAAVLTLPAATVITAARSGVPGHLFDVDTILLNVAGVVLCGLLVLPLLRAALRRAARAPEAPEGVRERTLHRRETAGAHPGHP